MHSLMRFLIPLCLLILPAPMAFASSMEELDDAALSGMTAQQGIAMNLEFRINALANGDPVPVSECPDVAGLTGGTSCRLALSFADRRGMWIVMKSYRGIIRLSNIRIDAVNLPNGWTTQTNGGVNKNPYLCALWTGSTCTTVYDPNNKPAIQLTTGGWSTAYAAGATSAPFYNFMNNEQYGDLSMLVNIDKLSAEYDCGSAVNAGAGIYVTGCSSGSPGWDGVDRVPGYLRNGVAGAAISLRMADGISSGNLTPSAPMQIRLDGRLQIFGY